MNKKEYTIYEIRHKDPYMLNTYVGMTLDYAKRKSVHKLRAKHTQSYKYPLYEQIRHFGGWENFEMRPLEIIECCSKREAECRETYWIKECNARMNGYKKPMTERELAEYKTAKGSTYVGNREKKLEYCREYYADNREKILEKRKAKYSYVKIGAPEGRIPTTTERELVE